MIGSKVADSLRELVGGRVQAVFEKTFYIKSGTLLFCVGGADMVAGPINCITSVPSTVDWRVTGINNYTRVRGSSEIINVGGIFQFLLSNSSTWMPEFSAQPASIPLVTRGVDDFRRAVAGRDDIDGLGRFLISGYRPSNLQHICIAAEEALLDAGEWLSDAFQNSDQKSRDGLVWIDKLSGLGQGLTPSGDDVLGGVMIALHQLGETDLCRVLWHPIKRCTEENSNEISLAHLSAAASGSGSASIHHIIQAIMNGDTNGIHASIDTIAAIGHSSGWDIMTGVIITLEAWLSAHTEYEKT
ncbi:DUF2877 domain-containing protein [Thalassospiraceae bacterium LMO-JJ14]|nr:DUF2877 domain-containing protein [Thalassospiraceae bacterium LMO-JJ14]